MTSRARLLIATTALTALALSGCGSDQQAAGPGDGATASDTTPASPADPTTHTPGESSTPDPSPAGGAGPQGTVAVPLYFLGDTPDGTRLFREFQQVSTADPADEALAKVAAGDATDPDYRSSFPAGSPTVASLDETIEIELPDASWTTRPAGMTTREARLAIQQLVRTAQGVLQLTATVGFTLDGASTSALGVDTSGGVRAAPDLDVLALVNVTTPEQGATVSGSFTASGLASSFEGTVPWQLRSADGTVVKEYSAQQPETFLDRLGPWSTEVDLAGVAPGDYVFAALTDDPTGGTEGNGPTEDTKAITVQ